MRGCNEESLGRQIYITSQEMKNFAERVLKPYELTLEQFHLLKNLTTDTGMSQREIGEIANKTPGNMTRILDRMESKDLVVRRDKPDDRRASLVFLTEKGDSLVDQLLEGFESFSARLVDGISEEEQQIVRQALAKLASNIKSMSEDLGRKLNEMR